MRPTPAPRRRPAAPTQPPATVTVGLRVTDNQGATATTTRTLVAAGANQQPGASFTATPNPATTGQSVAFNAAASTDPDGTIAKYEWDLDGNGTTRPTPGPPRPPAAATPRAGQPSPSGCG